MKITELKESIFSLCVAPFLHLESRHSFSLTQLKTILKLSLSTFIFSLHYNHKNLSKFCSIYSGQLRLRLSVIEKQLIKNGHLSLWLDFNVVFCHFFIDLVYLYCFLHYLQVPLNSRVLVRYNA